MSGGFDILDYCDFALNFAKNNLNDEYNALSVSMDAEKFNSFKKILMKTEIKNAYKAHKCVDKIIFTLNSAAINKKITNFIENVTFDDVEKSLSKVEISLSSTDIGINEPESEDIIVINTKTDNKIEEIPKEVVKEVKPKVKIVEKPIKNDYLTDGKPYIYEEQKKLIEVMKKLIAGKLVFEDWPENIEKNKFKEIDFHDVEEINVVDVSFKSNSLCFKYKFSTKDGALLSEIVKYNENVNIKNKGSIENEIVEAVKSYNNRKVILNYIIKDVINTDIIYDINKMIIDKTENYLIGDYKIGFDYKETDEYKNNMWQYPSIFAQISSLENWNKTINRQVIWNIYKSRHLIIYHRSVINNIEDCWKSAKDSVEKAESNELIEKWKLILNSQQAKNIICYCFPANKLFEKELKKLIIDSVQLYGTVLAKIRFIFTPYSIYLPRENKSRGHGKTLAVAKSFIETLNDSYEDVLIYNNCCWAAVTLKNIDETKEDKKCGSILLFDKF